MPSSNNEVTLQGQLNIPSSGVKALVVFAHGSGSGKESPRNQRVAKALNGFGFATLLVDLLTPMEQESDIKSQKIMSKIPGLVLNKFNIRLLSNRLVTITEWTIHNVPKFNGLPIGYFGASTGAAAAIEASILFDKVYAIVSRGGRPDLAGPETIQNVTASTLMIVGSKDSEVLIDLNKKVFKQLKKAKAKDLLMIPNADHLFEEDGAIEQVADVTTKWLITKLK
jgi:dienelactone hydrolase